jgi:predicted phage terminase large subunit-like protein
MPPRLFACFYENRPTTADQQIFKPEYFRTIREEDIPSAVWTYIFTDFAFIAEEKKTGRADRTVFWVVSLDCNRTAYVRDFWQGRWKPSDSVRIVCDLWDRNQHLNLKGVTIEDVTQKELLLSLFEEVRRQTFIRPRMIPIAGRSQEIKDMRIEAIEPRFRRGDIYFSEKLKEAFFHKWKPMISEMTEWPFTAHDDIPDAISDLDKRDPRTTALYCPGPPAGWRSAAFSAQKPALVNGRYNPERSYPARELVKAEQQGENSWLKLSPHAGNPHAPPGSQSIFKPQSNPPMPLSQFW